MTKKQGETTLKLLLPIGPMKEAVERKSEHVEAVIQINCKEGLLKGCINFGNLAHAHETENRHNNKKNSEF